MVLKLKLSNNDVLIMMDIQKDLNSNFTVSRWDDSVVETALICEYSEMMNELQEIWKVWKESENRELDAKIEFIDCIHFMLSALILRRERDLDGINICLPKDSSFCHGDFLSDLNKYFKEFLISDHSFPLSVHNFKTFVEIFTNEFEMDREEFLVFFETKKKINLERISNGYSEGKYSGKEAERARFQQ